MKEFEYIRHYYDVPAEFGREIEFFGRKGVIIQCLGNYIGVNFDDQKPGRYLPLHPTDNVKYLGIVKPRKMSASQKRYMHFLSLDSDLKFSEYLKLKF